MVVIVNNLNLSFPIQNIKSLVSFEQRINDHLVLYLNLQFEKANWDFMLTYDMCTLKYAVFQSMEYRFLC